MKMFAYTDSNIESIKYKNSEELFYRYLNEELSGIGLTKPAPFAGYSFDLLYFENDRAALFKFMDTNEDTFSILADEIVEVIEEEYREVRELVQKKLDGISLNYYFVMPFVELSEHGQKSDVIIDKPHFERLINHEEDVRALLSDVQPLGKNILFRLAKENFVFQKQHQTGEIFIELELSKSKLTATLMEQEQQEAVNDLHYGSTALIGSSGTGKTAVLLAKMLKLAHLYPKDKFLYITFDKQLAEELRQIIKYYHPDISNIMVINFHRFILMLGKKYNLKLNKKSKQSFNKEFEKVFDKVIHVFGGKQYFKGIFIDEAENFLPKEILFLKDILYSKRSFLCASFDPAKQMTPINEKTATPILVFDREIHLNTNFRASQAVGRFNLDFQNDINAFSALELDRAEDYFLPFKTVSGIVGEAKVVEYSDAKQMLDKLAELVLDYRAEGYEYPEIGIIYPYNEKQGFGNEMIYSRQMIKDALDKHRIPSEFAKDESSMLTAFSGVGLSNIFNATNLQWRLVIVCQLDTLYAPGAGNLRGRDIQKMLNIIYTATNRATEALTVMIREDEQRPGILDLLAQRINF